MSDSRETARERIGPPLGRVASGLYIAAGKAGGTPLGMLCSFVEQAGFEPPMLMLAIGKGRPFLRVLDEGQPFGLNILSKDNGSLMKPFLKPDNPDPFSGLQTDEPVPGAIRLSDAWGYLACRPVRSMDSGDHQVYLAEVLDGSFSGEGEPMVRVRRDGFGY
jgi:flavin reductase (DIM6/NTAB) family NADH-FMN oxidoreductase RutF